MLEVIIYIFCIYGFISLFIDIGRMLKMKINENHSGLKIIVITKNQGKVIEGVIRELTKVFPISNIKVVDMGSSDDTYEILKRLKKHNELVDIHRNEDPKRVPLTSFDDIIE